MKQKLLNKLWLRATMLVALMCVAFTNVWADEVTDVLDRSFTGVTGTSYSSWSGKTATSGAVYAGQSAGGNESIQLRSNNNNSGVVTTISGGKVKKITVDWQSATSNGRTLNVYGKNSAYSEATDLYDGTNQGTLIGTIVCGTSTVLTVDDDYEYIGFRSASGAMYLTSVSIVWETAGGGGTELEDCDLALTDAPIALNFDLYNNATAQTISYTTSSTGEVSVESGKYDVSCYVDNDQKTITVTPMAVTNGSQTVTVNQAADENYKAGSVTFTVTVTDSTPKTGAWVLTDLADLEEGDVFVIVGDNGETYAMSNNKGTGSAPAAVSVDIEDDEITSNVDDNIKWNISGNATDGYTFYPNGDNETWLYCTNSNNGVRVGTNDAKTFVIDSDYLKHSGTSRYVGIYNSQDWRCYTSINANIANQTFTFYKYVDGTAPQKADPELSFSSATAEATFGQDFTAPTLNTASGFDGTVEYTSSDETVAQVMDIETGELRIVGGGTTVITATFAGNDTYKKGSASYTLTVIDNRVATTITQENITLDIADIATLTQLTPVVKDANDNIVLYTNDPDGDGLPEVYFELVGEDTDGIIGSLDSHGNIILNSVVGTATIKAVYNQFQLNEKYRPSECTFTITIYQPLNGIAEFCNLTSGASGTLKLTDAVVLYVNGKDMFVRDNTGAIDFYNTGLTYEAGNILNGRITAKYTLYNNMYELTTPITDNTLVATAGPAVTPTEITTDDAADNTCNLVKLTGVTVTSSNNKFYVDDVQVYDKFKLNYTLEAGKTYDIVGIMIPYNSIYEICPIEAPTEIVGETPYIEVSTTTVEAPAAGLEGTIEVTYNNITDVDADVYFCDAEGNEATYDWVVADINGSNNVDYVIDENTSTEARTAYMKVYALDDNANDVYSELITITQAGYVVDYATLPFAWNGGTKDELLAETGVTANGLGSDYAASNAPYRVKLDTDGDYIQVKTDSQPVLVSLDVKMLGGSNTSTITVQESADGETFTDVEDLTIEGVQNNVLYLQTANAFSAETRYVRFYFTKGSNVGVGGITIENTFEEVATVGAVGYATYVPNYNVSFPDGVEAYITSVVNKEEGYVSMTQVTAVPKGTPVVLKGEAGTYTLALAAADALDDVSDNELKASDGTVEGDGTRYALGNGNQGIGFYRVKEGTLIAAGKAYLEISGADVKGFSLVFGDDATSINEELRMKSEEFNEGAIYDLSGRKINGQSSILNGQLPKGIYIVNGKKIAIK